MLHSSCGRKEWEKYETNSPANTKVGEEEIPLWTPWWGTVPLKPMIINGGADIHLQAVDGPMQEAGSCVWKRLWPSGEPALGGAGSWKELWPLGDEWWSKQSLPERLCPMEGSHAGAVPEELQTMRRAHTREIYEGLYPVGWTPCWSRRAAWGGRSSRD